MYSQWLRDQFKLHPEKKKAQLAKALGLEPPAISKILNDTRQIKAHEIAIIKSFFGHPVDGEITIDPETGSYNYSIVPSQKKTTLRENAENKTDDQAWSIPTEITKPSIPQPATIPKNNKIVHAPDSSMEPLFHQGEPLLVNLDNKTPPGIFLISDGHTEMIRYCDFTSPSQTNKIKISAESEDFMPQTLELGDFQIIGRITGKVRIA